MNARHARIISRGLDKRQRRGLRAARREQEHDPQRRRAAHPDLGARASQGLDVPYAYPVCVAIKYRQISYTAHRESHSTYPILTTALLHVKVWHSRLDQWQPQATHDSSGGPLQLAPECGVEVVTLGLVRPVVADVQVAATHRGQNEHGVSRPADGE